MNVSLVSPNCNIPNYYLLSHYSLRYKPCFEQIMSTMFVISQLGTFVSLPSHLVLHCLFKHNRCVNMPIVYWLHIVLKQFLLHTKFPDYTHTFKTMPNPTHTRKTMPNPIRTTKTTVELLYNEIKFAARKFSQ